MKISTLCKDDWSIRTMPQPVTPLSNHWTMWLKNGVIKAQQLKAWVIICYACQSKRVGEEPWGSLLKGLTTQINSNNNDPKSLRRSTQGISQIVSLLCSKTIRKPLCPSIQGKQSTAKTVRFLPHIMDLFHFHLHCCFKCYSMEEKKVENEDMKTLTNWWQNKESTDREKEENILPMKTPTWYSCQKKGKITCL